MKHKLVKDTKDFTINVVESTGKQIKFHTSSKLLKHHKQMLNNNQFVKSYSVTAYKE